MTSRLQFTPVESLEDLNRVNDAQKRAFRALADADPGLIGRRVQAYARRWEEALAHVEPGSQLLDIGCGRISQTIFDKITIGHQLDYHCMDIDQTTVAGVRDKLQAIGYNAENAMRSDNTVIPFSDGKFDFIFTSHCLEHSIDIVRTILECRRVLRSDGKLFLAVPLGFDDSAEHTLFLGPEEWLSLLSLCGFRVISYTVGFKYVEVGDLVVVAVRDGSSVDETGAQRLASRFGKADGTFARATDRVFTFPPGAIVNSNATIMRGIGSVCQISIELPPRALVIGRNDWAGMVLIEDGASGLALDAYSSVPYLCGVDLVGFAPNFRVKIIGCNTMACDQQIAIAGILF